MSALALGPSATLFLLLLLGPSPSSCHRNADQASSAVDSQQQQLHWSKPQLTREPLEPPKSDHKKAASLRSFTIDYQTNTFLKDGQHFRFISGSIHYFRVPRSEWFDRLLKAKMGGLNTIQSYIEWSSHEPQDQVYDFSGMLNFTEYCQMAQELGLNVIIRFGPFIASERDGMGLPYWLAAKNPKMKFRSSDASFRFYVQRWYKVVMPLLVPLLYQNGGPIIMGQVENEYGSYGCDAVYTTWLRDLIRHYVGPSFVLFTVDGASQSLVECGHIEGVYPTVDFGTESPTDVKQSFHVQRLFAPLGPLQNTEYYPGWFDTWGFEHQQVGYNATINTLAAMLQMNASVNIYMYHGGTSFGFSNGAYFISNPHGSGNVLSAMVTSYDYDAPITDVGQLTPKYWGIRQTIQKYFPEASPELSLKDSQVVDKIRLLSKSPSNSRESADGRVNITLTATFQSTLFEVVKLISPVLAKYPLSLDQLTVRHGFVLYETNVPFRPSDPIQLSAPGVRDRAHVFVNDIYRATLSRMDMITTTPLSDLQANDTLQLFVENQGRTCCSMNPIEQKGIVGNVTLDNLVLTNWRHYKVFANWSEAISADTVLGRPVNSLASRVRCANCSKFHVPRQLKTSHLEDCSCVLRDVLRLPSFYVAQFKLEQLPESDLFLNVGDCGHKGVAFMNGFNLGRYWPVMGPQVTLYIPRDTLSTDTTNTLVLFELDRDQRACLTVYLTDRHVINGTTPYNYAYAQKLRELKYNSTRSTWPHKHLGVPDELRPKE